MHGDELRQPAGLKLRRDQQGVGSCVDPVRPRFIVHDIRAHASLVRILIIPERVLIYPVSAAKHHDLRILVHNLGKNGIDQIQSLLIRQPGDQSDHKFAAVLDQAQFLLQLLLVLLFLFQHIGDVVAGVQAGIGLRVPYIIVDAVYNAAQFAGMIPQMGV